MTSGFVYHDDLWAMDPAPSCTSDQAGLGRSRAIDGWDCRGLQGCATEICWNLVTSINKRTETV